MQTKGSFSGRSRMSTHFGVWATAGILSVVIALVLGASGNFAMFFVLIIVALLIFLIGLFGIWIRRHPTQSG